MKNSFRSAFSTLFNNSGFSMGKKLFWDNAWLSVMLRGVLILILGGCFIACPNVTLYVLTWVFGILFMLMGLTLAFVAAKVVVPFVRSALIFTALIPLIIGLIMVTNPLFANSLVVMVIAFLTLSSGIQQLATARSVNSSGGYMGVSGVLSILFGVMIILAPNAALNVFGIVAGVFLLAFGMFTISLGIGLRAKNR